MDQRYGAWAHLIALFRMVHGGVAYDDRSRTTDKRVTIPARHGDLFDPDRFPFLEGRSAATTRAETGPVTLPRVPTAPSSACSATCST